MRRRILLTMLAGLAASTCGASPEQRPTNVMLLRNASRTELVEFVVPDPARAKRVRRLYLEVETVMLELEGARRVALAHMPAGADDEPNDDRARQVIAEFAMREQLAMEHYFDIQLELRQELNPEEFARLDRVK